MLWNRLRVVNNHQHQSLNVFHFETQRNHIFIWIYPLISGITINRLFWFANKITFSYAMENFLNGVFLIQHSYSTPKLNFWRLTMDTKHVRMITIRNKRKRLHITPYVHFIISHNFISFQFTLACHSATLRKYWGVYK